MKSVVIYYSCSGNTKKVAEILAGELTKSGPAQAIELIATDESKSFLGQCRRAFSHAKAEINPAQTDLSNYDLVCLGSPVWAFAPAPAMNTYLDLCTGLDGKKVILFTTYGSGTGNQRCLKYMQDILSKKGAESFNSFSVQQLKIKDREFVLTKIKESMRLWFDTSTLLSVDGEWNRTIDSAHHRA